MICVLMCELCIWGISLQLMVPGVHGSHGENALLPVGVDRAHVSVSVIIRLLATVVDRVQETPLSCPGVTLRPAQVWCFIYSISVQLSAAQYS